VLGGAENKKIFPWGGGVIEKAARQERGTPFLDRLNTRGGSRGRSKALRPEKPSPRGGGNAVRGMTYAWEEK